VPSEIVIALLKGLINDPKQIYMAIGIPKNMKNIDFFRSCEKEFNLIKFIYFQCAVNILQKRLENKLGHELEGLKVKIQNTISNYFINIRPVVSHFEEQNKGNIK